MPDIVAKKQGQRVSFEGVSLRGKRWITKNVKLGGDITWTIADEHFDEILKLLQGSKIEVEVK